jgi:hypothetical protein
MELNRIFEQQFSGFESNENFAAYVKEMQEKIKKH